MFSQGKKIEDGIITDCTDHGKEESDKSITSVPMDTKDFIDSLKKNNLYNKIKADDAKNQQPTRVSIVVVTYNSSPTIRECIESLLCSGDNVPFELILVDNASKDNTVEICDEILRGTDVFYKIITNSKNAGFSAAVNQGIQESTGEYIVLLNPDVVVFPGWLSRLLAHFRDSKIGAVGPLSDYVAGLQKIQFHCDSRELASIKSFEEADRIVAQKNQGKSVETKLLIGFCLMVRRDTFHKVGLLDEKLFLGNDDLDLSWRIREAGYKLLVASDVFVHHEGQVSFRSEAPIKTKLLVQESTNYLFSKLLKYYKSKVPSPQELWGIDWFTPYRFLTSIIILTRNNLEYTKMCLESIRRYTPEPHEIIVVDNGSTDGTIEYLEAQEDVKLIKNGLNLGFALGNNLGLREARGEYIVILNNDTVVTEGWLTRLINSAQSNPQVGIVGPRSNYVVGVQLVKNVPYGDNMDAMQEFARQWSLENSGRYEEALRVIGFCMLVKREVIEKIGGFDPYYEAGNFEDDDFCIRAQRAGFKIRIAHDVFIHHFGSKTFQSEKIDYRQVMLTNWERFKSKWGLPRELPIERGYPIYELIQGGFDQDKHFVPLSIEPLSLEELRSQTYLSEFNTLTLRWFLSNFEPQDDVTLVIYHPEEKAEEEVAKAIQELGYDIDKTPDILLYSHPLPENKIPSLVAAVDKVVVDSDSSPFLIWAKYLNKEVVEIETALHEP